MNTQEEKIDLHFDMETADPDDVMTLCLLANHSRINLRSVSVTPGTNEQIGLVRHVLNLAGLIIPIGSHRIGYDKNCVSGFHYKWLGNFDESVPDGEGHQVITETLAAYPRLNILTGAPLKNLSAIGSSIVLDRWIGQGGFAGDNIVPPHLRLPKFDGMITCPTFNFNGDPTTAESVLANTKIKERFLVSKNVCHGIIYDAEMHERFAPFKDNSVGLNLVHKGMTRYLEKKSAGKKYHDPLALAVAIDRSVCAFEEVEMYRQRGGWGAKFCPGSNTFIAISADKDKLVKVLTDQGE
jgi:pyrimidine-specific ribonucleoside hydrolase